MKRSTWIILIVIAAVAGGFAVWLFTSGPGAETFLGVQPAQETSRVSERPTPIKLQRSFDVTQITKDSSNQDVPDIFNNLIVYRNNVTGTGDYYISLYDISTATETDIATSSSPKDSPEIHSNSVVWMDERNDNKDIYLYDINDGREYQLSKDAGDQSNPDIYENLVVWDDRGDNNQTDIRLYDLTVDTDGDGTPNFKDPDRPNPDPAETQIPSSPTFNDSFPSISGNRVVYERTTAGSDREIYLYNIATANLRSIATTGANFHPTIHETRIVWSTDNPRDIYLFDIITGTTTQVTNNGDTTFESSPAIYGNNIYWIDDRSGAAGLYIYAIATETEAPVYLWDEASSVNAVSAYGGRAAFDRSSLPDGEGQYDIYLATPTFSTSTELESR
jgi:beta propeller repeat protein